MIHILDLRFQGFPLAIAAFLVETSDGLVLLETGPYSTYPILCREVAAKGFDVKDIKHVFLTHIHFDHAGAAWAFAKEGATVYLHPFGKRHMANPAKLVNSAKRIYKDKMDTLWGALEPIAEDKLRTVEHGESITIGDTTIVGWHTPGHAVHHVAWQIGDELIAGDVAGVKINNGMTVAPCPPPDIHVEDWNKSIELIKTLNLQALYLTHFGKITNVNPHLDELKILLADWANWIKPYYDAQASIEEVIPKFVAYVQQQLIDYGVDELGLKQYEAANPANMSVAGLFRYWKKHGNPPA